VTGDELDRTAKSDLKTLPKDLATEVARHLVMAGRLIDEDVELAYQHTLAARRLAARVGVVREACGLAAYHAGLWSVALSELRAAKRLTGQEAAYLPVMADAERGLGRPERALDLARSDEAKRLAPTEAIEMRIVESGARRDLGQHGAAVLALQVPELKDERLRPWSARLFYAYADALAEAGREDEAGDWFARAAAADRDGETDAAERYAEIEGLEIIDDDDDDDDDEAPEEA
jgi:tetratricopeptide (TPR) repeat protein